MTVEYVQNSLSCEKCGSLMIPRKMASQKLRPVKFIDIYQCDVCRFWHEK
ncbi:MAG: hypothetical protein ACFFBP_04355 [Promethearchaeota archaeon]